jgi:hypothetical protein
MLFPTQKKTALSLLALSKFKILSVAASVGPSSKVKRILLPDDSQMKLLNNF